MKAIVIRILTSVLIMCIAIMLALPIGCFPTLQPLGDNVTIGKTHVKGTFIELSEEYFFKYGLGLAKTLPSGRYMAKIHDDSGVYFVAPDKVIDHDPILGSTLHDGGLYIPFGTQEKPSMYYIYNNVPIKIELPDDFEYTIER